MQGDYVAKWNQSQLKWLYTWRNKRGRTTAALGTHGGERRPAALGRAYIKTRRIKRRESSMQPAVDSSLSHSKSLLKSKKNLEDIYFILFLSSIGCIAVAKLVVIERI
jgi:hypothetical protein